MEEKIFEKIKIKVNANLDKFVIPVIQDEDNYFPDFLKTKLDEYIEFYKANFLSCVDEYIEFYKANFLSCVDESVPFVNDEKNVIITKIKTFSEELLGTVNKYFEGDIFGATETFNKALNGIFFNDLYQIEPYVLKKNHSFYRARKNENKIFIRKEELFHMKFELRHLVSTNRYSVPGFPALYLADSTYTCWEEFERYKLRDLYFSRFENVEDLNVINIERIEDLLNELEEPGDSQRKIPLLLRYFVLFPLAISCSIKVKHSSAIFKPEYIISQLLLQLVSKEGKIDGIKFPSTKIDYSKLSNVGGYNYVFPVKNISKKGYCEVLTKKFHCTEPTSLELEEILYNDDSGYFSDPPPDKGDLELISGVKSPYSYTSFGKIEKSLSFRNIEKVCDK
jgi:hypothetical protein